MLASHVPREQWNIYHTWTSRLETSSVTSLSSELASPGPAVEVGSSLGAAGWESSIYSYVSPQCFQELCDVGKDFEI